MNTSHVDGKTEITRRRAAICLGRLTAVWLCAGVLGVAAACAGARDGGVLEPRFVAVHNALAALGLVQVGPIHEGTLAHGHAARVPFELGAGCTTIVAVAGEGVRNLDAVLLDGKGQPQAHDTTSEPQAVLRVCVDSPDAYVLVVSAAAGAGSWVAAAWQGGVGAVGSPSGAASNPGDARERNGTCRAPIPVTPGTVVGGSTTHGDHENTGSCGPSDARELVYELDVLERQRVTVEVEARFDSVLYLRKEDCSDADAEVDCSDDMPDRTHSRIERVLDPGKYYLFVDGYGQDEGPFTISVAVSSVLALAEVCRRAEALASGASVNGTTHGMADNAEATCGDGARGADAAWRIELPSRSRVRVVEHSEDLSPIVHVRRVCAEDSSEVACGDSGNAPSDAAVTGVFEAGTYAVFADASGVDAAGRYSLHLDVAPPDGSGTAGDGCGDALPIAAGIDGDTFAARDDVTGSCSGVGAADVVYRVDLPHRARFNATLESEEGRHVLVVWSRCGERASEVACAPRVNEVLAPGSYFVGVDGSALDALGRFRLSWSTQDLSGQGGACSSVTTLAEGRAITGTTVGAGDRFFCSCAGREVGATGADRVYRIVVPSRTKVRVTVVAPTFEVAIALRKTCLDATGRAGASELECVAAGAVGGDRAIIERALDAGVYWVVVDGQSPNEQGPFTLQYQSISTDKSGP